MLLPTSNQSIPMRTELTEIYGNHFIKKGHYIAAIISSTHLREYVWNGIQIYEVPSWNKLKKMNLAKKAIKEHNCNIIQVRNSSVDGIIGLHLKQKYGIPLIFQYTWPTLEAKKEWVRLKRKKPFDLILIGQEIIDFLQMKIMNRADIILPYGKWMKRHLTLRGISSNRMFSFPSGVNEDIFSPKISGIEKRRRYTLDSSSIIIYVGSMDELRQLSFLIHAFKRVKREVENVKLLMVGDGDDRQRLERLAMSLNIYEDVVFTGNVHYLEVPSFIATSDIAVSTIPPFDLYKVSSPLKIFEYMGSGKPIVANKEIPEQHEVIQESRGGILSPYDEEAFAECLIQLLVDKRRRERMGRNAREWVIKNRSYRILAKELEKVYLNLLS